MTGSLKSIMTGMIWAARFPTVTIFFGFFVPYSKLFSYITLRLRTRWRFLELLDPFCIVLYRIYFPSRSCFMFIKRAVI